MKKRSGDEEREGESDDNEGSDTDEIEDAAEIEDDDAVECSARAAEMLSCGEGDLICPACSQCGEDDAERDALLTALIALDALNVRWIARAAVSQ